MSRNPGKSSGAGAPSIPAAQHNIEIMRNREAWQRKPALRAAYGDFYRLIASAIDREIPGMIVELGSGMGNIKNRIPDCITTDIFPNPWLDRQENAYRLSFASGSVATLVLFDVWHHLRYPGTALAEFHRVLAPGGRVILFEPAISWLGRLVYGLAHHEPVALNEPVTWEAPEGFSPEKIDYFAAQGAATRMFWWKTHADRLAGWKTVRVQPLASFAYLATGGFSKRQIGNLHLYRFLKAADRILACAPRLLATRLLVILEKNRDDPPANP
ncbi:methyltransferase [Opitutaceae bacterium TAV5]|nr:methyltransferase [Opitutaceae bacterium TAV5]